MLPESCQGCPLYKRHNKFVPDKIPYQAKMVIYYDAPAATFSGDMADETAEAVYFQTQFLPFMQGINHEDVGYAHLFRCRNGNKSKGKVAKEARDFCRQYDDLTDETVLVAPGFLAWQYWTNRAGSRKDWGGYFVEMKYNGKDAPPSNVEENDVHASETKDGNILHSPDIVSDGPNSLPDELRIRRPLRNRDDHQAKEVSGDSKREWYGTGQPCPPATGDGARAD
jgi:uracil-DNA glycosylase